MQKKLNPVIINTLHVGVYMIELFSKAAIISVHVILLQILAVLWWSLGTVMHEWATDRHKKTNGLYFDKWILQFFSGLTTIRIPKRQIHFALVFFIIRSFIKITYFCE